MTVFLKQTLYVLGNFGQSLLLTSNDVHDSQTILRRNSTYPLLFHQKIIETTKYHVESTLQLKFFFDTLTKNLVWMKITVCTMYFPE